MWIWHEKRNILCGAVPTFSFSESLVLPVPTSFVKGACFSFLVWADSCLLLPGFVSLVLICPSNYMIVHVHVSVLICVVVASWPDFSSMRAHRSGAAFEPGTCTVPAKLNSSQLFRPVGGNSIPGSTCACDKHSVTANRPAKLTWVQLRRYTSQVHQQHHNAVWQHVTIRLIMVHYVKWFAQFKARNIRLFGGGHEFSLKNSK